MIESWHWNFYQNKSIFNELLELLNENRHIVVVTPEKDWIITSEDEVSVGTTAMMVASEGHVSFINTDYIVYAEMIDITPKNLNIDNGKDSIDNISNLNDSEEE